MKRVEEERKQTEQRLKRLGQVYLDDLVPYEDYKRQKRQLEDRLQSLVVPSVDAAQQAGKLLESLPQLWEEAELGERRRILMTMLEAVYVNTVEEKSIVTIRPKPAFLPLFQIPMTRKGSEVVLVNEIPPGEATDREGNTPCLWWRRGRVELPVQKMPRQNVLQAYPTVCSRSSKLPPAEFQRAQPICLVLLLSAWE